MNKKVLIVDDDESMRDLLGFILRILGYKVALAEDWGQAVGSFKREEFDILFTDFRMSAMEGISNGIEFIRFIKLNKINPGIKIILMSGVVEKSVESVALAVGADKVISKSDIEIDSIKDLLQGLLEGGD